MTERRTGRAAKRQRSVAARRCLVACAFAAVAVRGAAAASDHHGLVTSAGMPVPGAAVTATLDSTIVTTVSDEDGVFRLRGLADGTWTIRIDMPGFVAVSRTVTLPSTSSGETWELRMKPLVEIASATPGPMEREPPRNAVAATRVAPADGEPATEGAAADGFLINGSVNNAAASPFAQPRAFGNNRSQTGARYSGSFGLVAGGSRFDARPFSFASVSRASPSYADLRVLGTFGGPTRLLRWRPEGSRFFIGYQGSRDHTVSTESARVPTLLERRGDFSRTIDAFGRPVGITDPIGGLPFDAGLVPPDRISPQAAALLAYYPSPNVESDGPNYQSPVVTATRQDNIQARWNHAVKRNFLSATVAYQRTAADTTSLLGFTDASRASGIDTTVNWNRRLTQRFAIRLRYQFTRLTNRLTPYFENRINVSGDAGIAGNDQSAANWGPPRLIFADIVALADAQHLASRAPTHAVDVEGYLSRRRHNITFGGDARRHHLDVVSQQDPRGTFTFTGSNTGAAFADFLLGTPATAAIAFGNADKYFRSASFDAYVTDEARLTPTLTATIGVRWEYEAPVTERFGRLVTLDVAPGFPAVSPVVASDPIGPLTGRRYPASLVRPDKLGFQPRLALAWRPVPGSSLVVRAGYGVYRSTSVYQPIATLLSQQPPLSKTFSVRNGAAHPLSLAGAFTTVPSAAPNTFAVDLDFRVSVAHNWQASVQRDLPASLLIVATYLGSKGSRLMQQFLPNTYPSADSHPCPACPSGFVYLASTGSSSRHAAQVLLRRRLRSGLSASAQYTLAKAVDDAAAFSSGGLGTAPVAQDWLDLDAERGPSAFDQRHLLAVQGEYTTGVGRGAAWMDGWKGTLFKGWTIAGQLTAGSGLPVTPLYFTVVPGTGIVGVRPDLTGALVDDVPPGRYLNPAAYSAPAPGHWGTAGRNSARGPARFSCDASVSRSFARGDRASLEWRLDATNVLNRVTYATINTVLGPQFGLPAVANPMRKLQTSLRLRF